MINYDTTISANRKERNYTDVLRDIVMDETVLFTKNGRGRYAILDIEEY